MTLEGGKYNTQIPKLGGNFVKLQSTSGLAQSYLYSVTVNRHDFSLVSMCQNSICLCKWFIVYRTTNVHVSTIRT